MMIHYILVTVLTSLLIYSFLKALTKLSLNYILPISIFISNTSLGLMTIIKLGYLDPFFIVGGLYISILSIFIILFVDFLWLKFLTKIKYNLRDQISLYIKASYSVFIVYVCIMIILAILAWLSILIDTY